MIIKNIHTLPSSTGPIHDGNGSAKNVSILGQADFSTALQFVNYTEMPPKTSIGLHKHGNDEEVYVVLEGKGVMTVNDEKRNVGDGDLILNKPFGTHGLENTGDSTLKILVFAAKGTA